MASQVDEAERRVREQRRVIEQKLAALEGRVGDDLSHARERLQHHVTHAPDLIPGGPRLIEQAEQHPFAAIASGLGVGVAAGMLTGGGGDRSSSHHSNGNGRRRDEGDDNGFAATGLLTMLGAQLASPLRPYIEDAAHQVITGFSDRQRAARDRAESERNAERATASESRSAE